MRLPIWNAPTKGDAIFEDQDYWKLPEEVVPMPPKESAKNESAKNEFETALLGPPRPKTLPPTAPDA